MKKDKTVRHHGVNLILAGFTLALIVVGVCCPAGAGAGEQKIMGEWILPEHYPKGFDGYGYINRLAADEAVIDEALFRLSPRVTYTTLISVMAVSQDFTEGDLVGYITNSEQEIVSLWLIEKAKN